MADLHADFNAQLRRRARAGSVTLDLGDGEGTPQGAGLPDTHRRLEDAKASGDPVRIEEAENVMDETVKLWRERLHGARVPTVGTPTSHRVDFGQGARRTMPAPLSMTDRLRADAFGIDPRHLPPSQRTPERGST